VSIDRWQWIIPLRLRSLFRRNVVEQELDEELQYHIEQQTAENVRQGMMPREARTAALRALGNIEFRKEQVRDTRGTRGLEEISGDVRFAFRTLRRAPGFALTVILTLALGIGANTAMFTVLRGTLLRPLPNRDGGRLVYLRQTSQSALDKNVSFSVPEVTDLRTGTSTLASIAEYSNGLSTTLDGATMEPVRVRSGVVSGNYFDVMGLDPILGRLTTSRDDGAAAASVTVLSHEFWMKQFGGDSSVVGRSVNINGKPSTIIGVVQAAPHYPRRTDVFVNMVTSPHHLSATMVTERTHRMSELFARLAPNTTVDQAREEIGRISSNMFRDHPEAYNKQSRFAVSILPLRTALNERASLMFSLLMGAAAFVLLIACANVANLTLMRGVGREREMLVRAALGASNARLRRLLIAENLTLALIGGALGVLVAFAGLKLLIGFAAQLTTRANEIRIDGVVLAVGLVTSIAAAFALSFVPRVGGQRALAESLAPAGRRSTLARGRKRLQQSLVVVQLAVCMVLLTGAGLLVRTLSKVQSVDSGVRTERVVTADLPIEGSLEAIFTRRAEHVALYERIRDRVAALPGVEVASIASAAPLRTALVDFDVKAEGRPASPNEPAPHASMKLVDANYFNAVGIPLRKGRNFATTDRQGTPRVVILSETFAKQLFGNEDPIGRRVAWSSEVLKFSPISGEWRTVIGVAGDTRDQGVESAVTPTVFEPFAQEIVIAASLVVRTTGEPAVIQPTIVRAIREIAPRQLIDRVMTLEQIRDERVAPRRLNAMFIGSFGTLAMLIAMVGIAGVLAFSVSSRTSEIAIRMSLGATAAKVYRMILGQGGALLGVGLAVGLLSALGAARLLRGLLFGVTPYDPVTLGGVAILLAAVGIAACWLPAARAARVDPAAALRAE
jgi:predicted permease